MSRLLNFRDYLHRLSKTKTNNKKQTYSLEYANHWHADRHVAIDGLAIGTIKSTPGESCARVALETPGYSHLFYFLYSNSYDTLSFFQAQVLCKNLTHYNRKHGSVIAPCTTPSHQHSLARSGCSIYVWGGVMEGEGPSVLSFPFLHLPTEGLYKSICLKSPPNAWVLRMTASCCLRSTSHSQKRM